MNNRNKTKLLRQIKLKRIAKKLNPSIWTSYTDATNAERQINIVQRIEHLKIVTRMYELVPTSYLS